MTRLSENNMAELVDLKLRMTKSEEPAKVKKARKKGGKKK